jgi:hypothetical protein
MRSKHATKLFIALFILSTSAIGNAQGTFVAGPIEKISLNPRSITVLGQTVAIDDATALLVDGKSRPVSQAAADLSLGNFAFVATTNGSKTPVAQAISTFRTDEYVAGASFVALAGKVTALNGELGILRIGALKVDISAVRPETLGQLSLGSVVQISGIQPNLEGVLVGPVQLSLARSGSQRISIGGSGVQSISIGGSGVQSIGGSGFQQISIGGSGVKSIGGSGAQKLSIGGSGFKSIGGSGVQYISIGGSGINTLSIGGSGVDSLSIGGSGIHSIGGSGVDRLSIGGSGAQKISIGGSGIQSIGGSGAESLSIGGSGVQKVSIGGSGVQKSSIGGSGLQ